MFIFVVPTWVSVSCYLHSLHQADGKDTKHHHYTPEVLVSDRPLSCVSVVFPSTSSSDRDPVAPLDASVPCASSDHDPVTIDARVRLGSVPLTV
jgi:hypothetical protein